MTDPNPAHPGHFDDLKARLFVAVILGVVALAFQWIGGWLAALFVAAVCVMMLVELVKLVEPECKLSANARLVLLIAGGVAVFATYFSGVAFLLIAVAGIVTAGAISTQKPGMFLIVGSLFIMLAGAGGVHLREIPDGFPIVLWLVLCVIAADVGGYAFGRLLQGPKLVPRISPAKTWAGFGGGMFLTLIVCVILAYATGADLGVVLFFGVVISIISVAGDLLESSVKRRFGVKDAGDILPGHGGLLDRLDGMAAVIVFFFAMSLVLDLSHLLSGDPWAMVFGGWTE